MFPERGPGDFLTYRLILMWGQIGQIISSRQQLEKWQNAFGSKKGSISEAQTGGGVA